MTDDIEKFEDIVLLMNAALLTKITGEQWNELIAPHLREIAKLLKDSRIQTLKGLLGKVEDVRFPAICEKCGQDYITCCRTSNCVGEPLIKKSKLISLIQEELKK